MKQLNEYNFPEDLKNMSYEELDSLSEMIRTFLIEKVSEKGGHLASNLGVVELTIALHKVFESPVDKIIFDVGDQTYDHKLLTGRLNDFDTLREYNGLSGFPKRRESEHDHFDTGHSSTSLSFAYGMSKARDLKGDSYSIVPVIGDGSLTGGEAFEALNNIGLNKTNIIMVLNDNGISISKNVGSLPKHLSKLRTSKNYLSAKSFVKNNLANIPGVGKAIFNGLRSIKNNIKYQILKDEGDLFEQLGVTYLGPVDGHNIEDLVTTFEMAKKLNEPVLVHVITKKGKGYSFAENDPSKFHGISPFDISTGEVLNKSTKPSYSAVAGSMVTSLAEEKNDIVAVTAAMGDAVGLKDFSIKMKNRYFDVGIAEQHAVTFSAGLAQSGLKPYVFIYSSFLQRAYDQIIEDVCLQNLPVTFMVDRAGVVGQDGETHHGIFDLSYFSSMPNMTVFTPYDENTLNEAVKCAYELNGPAAIRYPRGECGVLEPEEHIDNPDVLILGCGKMAEKAKEVSMILRDKGIKADAEFISCIKPLTLPEISGEKIICTLEDNVLSGGFSDSVNRKFVNSDVTILNFGWPDRFIEHGKVSELEEKYGLTAERITEKVLEYI
ncbi:MAG: 1-deoxy-D-xylulose-5-phosphate synthase [Clostridia bacterium]|nr:1-deoxy-D-xylulose-5-phosphate synthase [Clostridia bacterium]